MSSDATENLIGVGFCDGSFVGLKDGLKLGRFDGNFVGLVLGSIDGIRL